MTENGLASAGYILLHCIWVKTVQMFRNSQFFSNLNFYIYLIPMCRKKCFSWVEITNPCISCFHVSNCCIRLIVTIKKVTAESTEYKVRTQKAQFPTDLLMADSSRLYNMCSHNPM